MGCCWKAVIQKRFLSLLMKEKKKEEENEKEKRVGN